MRALLAVVCAHLGCSLALVDESGRVVGERHAASRLVVRRRARAARGRRTARSRCCARRKPRGSSASTTASCSTTARRRSRSSSRAAGRSSAAELRLAGDLLEDLEDDRLDERETAPADGRVRARPAAAATPRSSPSPTERRGGEDLRAAVAERARRAAAPYLSDRAARPRRVSRRGGARGRRRRRSRSTRRRRRRADARVGRRTSGSGRGLGRSLARGARRARRRRRRRSPPIATSGSLELLLSLPDASLEAFVDRVLGPAADNAWLLESLAGAARHRLPLERGGSSASACTGTRCATGWSGCASRPVATPTTPPSAWSSGSRSRRARPSRPAALRHRPPPGQRCPDAETEGTR